MLSGAVDRQGRIDARFVHQIKQSLCYKIMSSLAAESQNTRVIGELDFMGKDFTATASVSIQRFLTDFSILDS